MRLNPSWIGWLPRCLLDQLETSEKWIPSFPDPRNGDWFRRFQDLRIALVRQDVFGDLYCAPRGVSGPDLVRQSIRRTGPAGLVVDFQADYWILREDPAVECAVWTEKLAGAPASQWEASRTRKDKIPGPGFTTTFAEQAVGVDEVPWEDYDLVVAVDIAVPFRILARTRRPLWAYLPGDPGVPTAKASLREPPGNYDLSLTHSFRRFPVRPGLGRRTVEFPYTLVRQETWQKIFPSAPNTERHGTMVEHQTESLLTREERTALEALGPIRRPAGSITEVAHRLNQSRYYFRCGGGPIVGNGLVEAAAAGCVAFANHKEFVNRSLLCRSNLCVSRREGIKKILNLNSDSENYARLRALQGRLVDHFCFYRPIREIWEIWKKKKG